jgi:hypothetical protein
MDEAGSSASGLDDYQQRLLALMNGNVEVCYTFVAHLSPPEL